MNAAPHWKGEPEVLWERETEARDRMFQEWEDDQFRALNREPLEERDHA
jgi:hypothetical protein